MNPASFWSMEAAIKKAAVIQALRVKPGPGGARAVCRYALSVVGHRYPELFAREAAPLRRARNLAPGFAAAAARIGTRKESVIATPVGEVVQDTAEIIDFRDAPSRALRQSRGPEQRLVALLFGF
jgi:hypothetical protein